MSAKRDKLIIVAGAFVACILQCVLPAAISVFGAMPNLVLAYGLALAYVRMGEISVLLPLLLGLFYNLTGSGPVGSCSLIMLLLVLCVAPFMKVFAANAFFSSIVGLFISVFIAEVFYAVILIYFGLQVGFAEALVYKALPCALYDFVAAALFYLALTYLLPRDNREGTFDISYVR